jgi:ethanolamine utilization protein EutA
MNIDIGGGTTKIAVCEGGELVDLTAIDIGARLLALDGESRLVRMEEAGRYFLQEAGLDVAMGETLTDADLQAVTDLMAGKILEACGQGVMSADTAKLLRLPELKHRGLPDVLTFSGGVSEYIYGREPQAYGDLGPQLAQAVLAKAQAWGAKIGQPDQGIRATVIGASQYTVQISGSTIYVEPAGQLPLRNVPVIAPVLDLQAEVLDVEAIAQAIRDALIRVDMHQGEQAVGLCYQWQGSATFARLDAFCRAVGLGMKAITDQGHALLLVGDADCGGLIGIHCHEELHMTCPVISIDGIQLKALDFIDVGAMLETSGAVPVVIKSLVFPATAALGQVHKV